jgi:hypothetical protein
MQVGLARVARDSRCSNLIAFPSYMVTPSTAPEQPNQNPAGWNPQKHGTSAQIATAIVAGLSALASLGTLTYVISTRHADQAATTSDEHINSLIDKKLEPTRNDIVQIRADIGTLKGQLEQLNSDLKHTKKLQLDNLTIQFHAFQKAKITVDPTVLADLGKEVVDFSRSKEPDIAEAAWTATASLASYRSFLNVSRAPDISNTKPTPDPANFGIRWQSQPIPGAANWRQMFYFPNAFVPASEAAIFTDIGRENQVSRAPPLIVFDAPGTAIKMDGQHWKNVVIRDAMIVYTGGPAILENVLFVNCTFSISRTGAGQTLAEKIVSSPKTTFKNA